MISDTIKTQWDFRIRLRFVNKIIIIAFVALILLTAVLPANAAINVTGLEIRGNVATGSAVWDNSSFAGFFYDIDDNLGTELLSITASGTDNRTIAENDLVYATSGQEKILKVVSAKYNNNGDNAAADGLEQFGGGKMALTSGYYTIIGWKGEKYVAIKEKTGKLAKLIIEQNSNDDKNLATNESWIIGGGWNLTVKSIQASSKSVTFFLTKDGIKKDDISLNIGKIYTYVEANIANESNVPMFVTYINNITAEMVQFRYTWAISTNVTEINAGDKFGSLKVTSTTDPLILRNSGNSIILSPDTTIDVIGNIKIKVANDYNLRYYPFVARTTPGIYDVRGGVETGSASWDTSTFSGFFYDVDDNLGTETLYITTSGSDSRTIAENDLTYYTSGQEKMLKLVDAKYGGDGNYAAIDGLEQFDPGKMATISGSYTIIGWMSEKYVAIKMKPNKLSKLLVEQGTSAYDKKTLTIGETWEIGGGYSLTANSIDAMASPRQVWITLSRDGVKKDDKVVTSGGQGSDPIYTYVEKSFCGETDVPVLVTYVDSVFTGVTTDMVQFRYTWLISPSCTEVKSSDVFGSMKVTSTMDPLTLRNTDTGLTLYRGTNVDVMDGLRLRVADSSALRYYPFVTFEVVPPPPPPKSLDTLRFESKEWNLVSVPKTLNDPSVGIAFKNLSSDSVIWYYDSTNNTWEHPSAIKPLQGYWVYNNASMPVYQELDYKDMSGQNIPPSMILKTGWNLIGHTSTQLMPVSSALISIDGKYSHLLSYSSSDGWKTYIAGNPAFQQFKLFEPGRGYWIFMTQDAIYASVDM